MIKRILLLLIIPVFVFGQAGWERTLFPSGNDTIKSITTQDTIQWRIVSQSGLAGPWNNVTNYITAAEKTAETVQVVGLASETGWSRGYIQLRIVASALSITSQKFGGLGDEGSFTAFIKPDTVGTNTFYTTSVIIGK